MKASRYCELYKSHHMQCQFNTLWPGIVPSTFKFMTAVAPQVVLNDEIPVGYVAKHRYCNIQPHVFDIFVRIFLWINMADLFASISVDIFAAISQHEQSDKRCWSFQRIPMGDAAICPARGWPWNWHWRTRTCYWRSSVLHSPASKSKGDAGPTSGFIRNTIVYRFDLSGISRSPQELQSFETPGWQRNVPRPRDELE
jgi:hypothetical protein